MIAVIDVSVICKRRKQFKAFILLLICIVKYCLSPVSQVHLLLHFSAQYGVK